MLGTPYHVQLCISSMECSAGKEIQVRGIVLTGLNVTLANTPAEPKLVSPKPLEVYRQEIRDCYDENAYGSNLIHFIAPSSSFTIVRADCV